MCVLLLRMVQMWHSFAMMLVTIEYFLRNRNIYILLIYKISRVLDAESSGSAV